MMAAFSEGLAVADKAGLSTQTLLEVLVSNPIQHDCYCLQVLRIGNCNCLQWLDSLLESQNAIWWI